MTADWEKINALVTCDRCPAVRVVSRVGDFNLCVDCKFVLTPGELEQWRRPEAVRVMA